MIIKLIKDIEGTKVDSIVEADDITAKDYITKGIAIEYTKEVESKEQEQVLSTIEVKSVKDINKREIKNMDMKDKVEFGYGQLSAMLLKGMKMEEIITKLGPSGQSEGVAADGGNLVFQAVSELQGIALEGNKLYSKVNKKVLPAGANAMKVAIDNSDPWISTNAPVSTSVAEGYAKTPAKLAFTAVTCTPKTRAILIPTTEELLQDVPSIENDIKTYARGKMGNICDDLILNGYSGTSGVYGILDSNVSGFVVTVDVSATPTLAELVQMEMSVAGQYTDSAEWFMPYSVWSLICGALATYNNINLSNIDIAGKKLLGRPVNIMHTMPADSLVIGSPKAYMVVEPAVNDVLRTSYDIYFATDEVAFRLTKRIAGTPIYAKRTASDGSEIAGFAIADFASA